MSQCDNCGAAIGKMEERHEWDNNSLLCAACYRKLRAERAQRSSAVANSNAPGQKQQKIGGFIAITGIIVAAVGWRMIDPIGEQWGVSQTKWQTVTALGVVACLIGMLWFAVGRMKAR